MKSFLQTLRERGRIIRNAFLKSETMSESKEKWNKFAKENSRYYVMTDYGKMIDEETFQNSGKKDYEELVAADPMLSEKLSPFITRSVLEIGCGTGRITEFFGKNFKEVSGIDISEEMIEEGKRRLRHLTNLKLEVTDGRIYPFPDQSFDLVFSFIVFQHMPDKETVEKNLLEIDRVLKNGGIAKIQFRGEPASKKSQFYGPSFRKSDIETMISPIPLSILKTEDVGKRYFWVWFGKNS